MKDTRGDGNGFGRITNLRVIGGFLDGIDLELSGDLNCIIGARGTGKSTVIEMARYALDCMPGREGDPLREHIAELIENNLDGGRVELTFETAEGMTYKVSRAAGESPILLDENDEPLPPDLRASQLFQVDVFSQNQIENIAGTPRYQLELIDGFEEARLAAIGRDIATLVRQLEGNAAQILPLMEEEDSLRGALAGLAAIQEKLKGYQQGGGQDAEEVNRAHALKAGRDREMREVDAARDLLKSQAASIERLAVMELDAIALFDDEMLSGPNAAAIKEIRAGLVEAALAADLRLRNAIATLREAAETLAGRRSGLELAHAAQDLEFRKLIEKHRANQAQSAERAKLERQQNDLLARQRRLKEVEAQIVALHRQRDGLLSKLSEERDRRFAVRNEVATRLTERLQPTIRVSVEQSGDGEEYRRFLESALRNQGIQAGPVSRALAAALAPQELIDLIRAGDATAIARTGGINPNQAAVVLKVMGAPARQYELQTVEMDDVPAIELCDNGTYKNSARLSTGQKCTAILPILMSESSNPLLVDQPEDNLDNRFICKTVLKEVEAARGARQLVFVTHNPNIPVLGDATEVIVMQSDGETASVAKAGDVDHCKGEIVTLLEGGAEAFAARGKRYSQRAK